MVWRSLGWPLIHDAPLMHYIAWVIGQGGVPYRDVFDMNLPGVYLIHWAMLSVGGAGDLAWRGFDLAWLAATCALLFTYCRPATGGWAAAGAAMLFALYHLSGGAWRAGQRDFLLGVFLLAGADGVARAAERGGARWPLVWAGLALGAGMTVKPYAGLFWAICVLIAAGSAWRAGRSALLEGGTVLATGLVIPALVFGWLAWRGGLGAFIAILGGYVVPLYSQIGRVTLWQPFGWYRYGWALWGLLAGLAALALLAPVREGMGLRRALAVLGAGYGLLHFALQGKGWEYHLYSLALFVSALAAFAIMRVRGLGLAPRMRRAVALALVAATVVVLGAKGVDAIDAPWVAEKSRRVAALTRDLRALVPPGGTVQVMDVTAGGIHALFNLRLRQPSRFLYDFHFFHHPADPRIQALRAELVSALQARPPDAIVLFQESWNRPPHEALSDFAYERLADFPEVSVLLARGYTRAVEGDGYRIYAKRRGP